MKIKFKWPYLYDVFRKDSEITAAGKPVAKIINVEETEEGIYVTAEFYDPESKIAKTITGFDPAGMSIGPFPTNPTMQDYAKADVEMTAALYGVHPEAPPFIHSGNWLNRLILLLAGIGLWFVIFIILEWLFLPGWVPFKWFVE